MGRKAAQWSRQEPFLRERRSTPTAAQFLTHHAAAHLTALVRRRHIQRHPAEAVEVLAQRASLDGALEVSAARHDAPPVEVDTAGSAHTTAFALLEASEGRPLGVRAKQRTSAICPTISSPRHESQSKGLADEGGAAHPAVGARRHRGRLEAPLQAERGVTRVAVPLRSGKVTARFPGGDMPLEGVSVAELSERMAREMVGWDGIEPPTPGFSVGPGEEDHAPPSSPIDENQADSEP